MADEKLIRKLKKQITRSVENDSWLAKVLQANDLTTFERGGVVIECGIKDTCYYIYKVEVTNVGRLETGQWTNYLNEILNKRWPIANNDAVQSAIDSLIEE